MLMGDSDPRRGLGGAGSSGNEPLPPVLEENDRLSSFLLDLGLAKYTEVFERQAVDYNTLLSFSDEDLKNIGIK